jgi:hypothetical protein
MNANFSAALQGLLASPSSQGAAVTVQFQNQLQVGLDLYWLDQLGNRIEAGFHLAPAGSQANCPVNVGDWFLAICQLTGSFVCVVTITATDTNYIIDDTALARANDVGPVPAPTSEIPLPPDSPRVLTAAALTPAPPAPAAAVIVRESFWQRSDESYSLGVEEEAKWSLTTFTGRETTSSDEETVSKSLSASISGGWGPVSASVSASLTSTSRSSQQVTVQNTQTKFVELTATNTAKNPIMVLKWNLVDVITVFTIQGSAISPSSSIISTLPPTIVSPPYDLTNLPSPSKFVISEAMRVGNKLPAALPAYKRKAFQSYRFVELHPDAKIGGELVSEN